MPILTSSIIFDAQNATVGDVVFKVRAADGDGDTVTYSFSNDQQEVGPFVINATTGLIILTQTLDREIQQSTEVLRSHAHTSLDHLL